MEKEKLIDALKEGIPVNKKGYFDSYKENIFGGQMSEQIQEMFEEGSGGELHSKAEAIHSSSMLSYNFFHWIDEKHPFIWDDTKYTQVFFEVKMKTIKNSPAPANMDVVLIDEDKKRVLFIESKFTEYTKTTKFELSNSYKNNSNWYDNSVRWDEIVKYIPERKYKYKEGIKQLISHLFGIHSQFVEPCDTFKKVCINFETAELKFITLIFEPSKRFEDEHTAYQNYKELFDHFRSKIINLYLKVVPEWKSYGDLWKIMEEQMPEDLKDYISKRYMQFANK